MKKNHINPNIDMRENLFILSGPSGCGKNTVYSVLKRMIPDIQRAITATTRAPRPNEIHGMDYYFLSEVEYFQGMEQNSFVESAFYDNAYYATPIYEIERYSTNTPVFLIIDTRGKAAVKCRYPRSTTIFLMPPSIKETIRRIEERGANNAEQVERRICRAKAEIDASESYDYIIVNDDLKKCVDHIEKIVREIFCFR